MTPIERLLAKVVVDGDCLLTTGPKATVKVNGRGVLHHRVIWEHHHGPVPDGAMVRRVCGQETCVNEEHLGLRWRDCAAERVLASVIVDPDTFCLLWTGPVDKDGRGQVVDDDGKQLSVQRWAFKHWRGPVPDGLHVKCRCDRSRCLHPDHLMLALPGGTTAAADTTPAVLGQRLNYPGESSLLCARGHLVIAENAQTVLTSGEAVRCCVACQPTSMDAYLRRAKERRFLDELVRALAATRPAAVAA